MTGQMTGHTSALDLLAPEHRGLFIGGAWREAEGGGRLDVVDPADGSVLTDVADASPADAVAALDAAVAAQADWARTPPRDRGEILRRAFEMITDRADDFAGLMSLEMGKTVKEAKGEVTYGAEFFRWYSGRRCGSTVAGCRRRPAAAGCSRSRSPWARACS
jgi:succinate-semialdehyde dehydrogenase/glutarate-semialdehyde dehydrogenase